MTSALRGQVFRIDIGHGPKPWVVVSNNQRNGNLETVIAARITTTDKHAHVPTVVPLAPGDPLVGFVLCDDLWQFYDDELASGVGSITPRTMRAISVGLRIALP